MIINIDNFVFDSSQIKMLTPITYDVLAVRGQATYIEVECKFDVVLDDRTFVFRFKYKDMDLYNDAFAKSKDDVIGNKKHIDFSVYDLQSANTVNYEVNSHIKNNFKERIDFKGILLLRGRIINFMRTERQDRFRLVPYFELSDFNSTKLHE